MVIEDLLKNVKLPAIYKREGKDCYYDTYRKKLIEITPEETIRQKVAALFEHQYGVPKDMILLEVPMSYYVEGASGRADIVIHMYDEDTDQYVFLDKILTYGQMIHKEYTLPEYKEEKEIRFTLEELQNQELIWDYNDSGSWIFGEDTPEALRSLAVNLYQALLDTGHKLPIVKRKNFEILEDLGHRYMDYGNAGGGHYNGVYRAFLVNDRFVKNKLLYLDDKDVSELIYSFIEYALLREEVRRRKKKER